MLTEFDNCAFPHIDNLKTFFSAKDDWMAQFSSGRILSQFIFKNTEAVQVSEQENELVWSRDFVCIPVSKYRPNCINKSPVISRQDRNIRGRTISGGSAYRSEARGKEKEKKKRRETKKERREDSLFGVSRVIG